VRSGWRVNAATRASSHDPVTMRPARMVSQRAPRKASTGISTTATSGRCWPRISMSSAASPHWPTTSDTDRHHQRQAEYERGGRVERAQRRQEKPVERQDRHDPDRECIQDPGTKLAATTTRRQRGSGSVGWSRSSTPRWHLTVCGIVPVRRRTGTSGQNAPFSA
jgi:hypothetical protein